jgi:hypothetical protein
MSKYDKPNPGQKPKDGAYEDFKLTLHNQVNSPREPLMSLKAGRSKAPSPR